MTDDEKDRALCEAHCNSSADEYFNARPQLDSDVNRRIFYAGHRKAWIERGEAVRLNAQADAKPMFWVRLRSDGGYEGPIHDSGIEDARKQSGAWHPLYLAAPAAPQPTGEKDALLRQALEALEPFELSTSLAERTAEAIRNHLGVKND